MSAMAAPKKQKKAGGRTGSPLGIAIDPELRAAADDWIERYNLTHEHRATLTSFIEAAIRKYIATVPPEPQK